MVFPPLPPTKMTLKFPYDDTHNCCFLWQFLNLRKHPAVAPNSLLKLSAAAPLSNERLQSAVEPSNYSLPQLLSKSPIVSLMFKQSPTASQSLRSCTFEHFFVSTNSKEQLMAMF